MFRAMPQRWRSGPKKVAKAIAQEIVARGFDAEIVRNGSRGMFWLEPLVEVEIAGKRIGYGSVKAKDVPGLFDAGMIDGGEHRLCLGRLKTSRSSRNRPA